MAKFFLLTKRFVVAQFFLVTIFLPFRDHSIYVKMADNNNNEISYENDLIKGYYFQGFEYKDILRFLYQYHSISMSKSTLQRRLKSYDVGRKYAECNIGRFLPETHYAFGRTMFGIRLNILELRLDLLCVCVYKDGTQMNT